MTRFALVAVSGIDFKHIVFLLLEGNLAGMHLLAPEHKVAKRSSKVRSNFQVQCYNAKRPFASPLCVWFISHLGEWAVADGGIELVGQNLAGLDVALHWKTSAMVGLQPAAIISYSGTFQKMAKPWQLYFSKMTNSIFSPN